MLDPNSRPKSWIPKMHVFSSVLDNGANLTPQIITQAHRYFFSMMLQRVLGDREHLKDLTTSLVSPTTVEITIVFHQNGEVRVDSIVRELLWTSLLSSILWAESLPPPGNHDYKEREAWCALPGNTQNLMFLSSQWKLDNCPSVSLYVPFMAACSVSFLHMCFFMVVISWKILLSVWALEPLSKRFQFNSSILKWEFFSPASLKIRKCTPVKNHKIGYWLKKKKSPTFWRDRLWVSELPMTGHKMSLIFISCLKLKGALLPNLSKAGCAARLDYLIAC